MKGLTTDWKGLRKAYKELPALTAGRSSLIRHIVTVASVEADAIRAKLLKTPNRSLSGQPRMDAQDMMETIGEALVATRGQENREPGETAVRMLADLIMAMVKHDPALPFTVENIARAAYLTPNYFSSLFKKQTGRTFIEFLTAQRIELAQRLLQDYRLDIAEVAERAGFRDQAYFCRRFKAALGVPPRAWRQGKQCP
jgi:AraC-like DNA-binding protein